MTSHPAEGIQLLEHVSEWTLENIAQWFKKWYESPKEVLEEYPNMSLLLELYHWAAPGQTLSRDELMNDKSLNLSDNSLSWNDLRSSDRRLYRVMATVQEPLCLMEHIVGYEDLRPVWKSMTDRNFDSVIYTPSRWLGVPQTRQIELLDPHKSIKSIECLGIYNRP